MEPLTTEQRKYLEKFYILYHKTITPFYELCQNYCNNKDNNFTLVNISKNFNSHNTNFVLLKSRTITLLDNLHIPLCNNITKLFNHLYKMCEEVQILDKAQTKYKQRELTQERLKLSIKQFVSAYEEFHSIASLVKLQMYTLLINRTYDKEDSILNKID